MKYEKPVAFNYAEAMRYIEELESENEKLKDENRRLRTNLEIKERIEWQNQRH